MNISRDRAQVCATESPAATDTAPNETPYAPVARPTPRLSRTIAARSCGVSGDGARAGSAPGEEVVHEQVPQQQAGDRADDRPGGRPRRAAG